MALLKSILAVIVLACTFETLDARHLSDAEKQHIDMYLKEQGLNRFGDPQGTMYVGGTPLFDEATGQVIDRHEYVLLKHPRILDSFTGILPVDVARKVTASLDRLANDVDGRRVSERYLESLVNLDVENAILLDSLRKAIDAGNYAAVLELLGILKKMDDQRLSYFSQTLRDVRRMLQAPTIQPVDVTEMARQILSEVSDLQQRIRA